VQVPTIVGLLFCGLLVLFSSDLGWK